MQTHSNLQMIGKIVFADTEAKSRLDLGRSAVAMNEGVHGWQYLHQMHEVPEHDDTEIHTDSWTRQVYLNVCICFPWEVRYRSRSHGIDDKCHVLHPEYILLGAEQNSIHNRLAMLTVATYNMRFSGSHEDFPTKNNGKKLWQWAVY